MNKEEVGKIIALSMTAYPSFIWSKEQIALWVEMLADIPYELGEENIRTHIKTSQFPPTIADIAKQPEQDNNPYSEHKQLTNDHLLFLEEAKAKAVPMPEDMFKEWLEDE